MKARTSKTRIALAAAILTALPLASGALRADPIRSPHAAETRSGAGEDTRPQWMFAMGEGPLAITCVFGGWRCALTAL